MNVTLQLHDTADFPAIFSKLASWGVNGIRLVLHADPNRKGANGTTFQHDHFFRWKNAAGVFYPGDATGVYENGDRLAIDDTGFTKLMTVLGYAKAAGLSVVLDMHSWPGKTGYDFWSCSNPDAVTNTAVPQAEADAKGIYFQQQYRLFWSKLINFYLAKPQNQYLVDTIVGYDLMNEPDLITGIPQDGSSSDLARRQTYITNMSNGSWQTPAVWANYSNHNLNYHRLTYYTVGAIRDAEAQLSTAMGRSICKTTIVEGWGIYGDPGNFAWMQPVDDPMNNTAYSFHMYTPHFFTDYTRAGSYYPSVVALGDTQNFDSPQTVGSMQPVANFLTANSLSGNKMFVGELGTVYQTDNRGADVWAWDAINYFTQQNWHWSWWSNDGSRSPELNENNIQLVSPQSSKRLSVLKVLWQGQTIARPIPVRP